MPLAFAIPGISHAATIINAADDFATFVQRAHQTHSDEELLKAWSAFESKYGTLFADLIFKNQELSVEETRKKRVPWWWDQIKAKTEIIVTLHEDMPRKIDEAIARFKVRFPDLPDDLTIYVVPTLFRMNGAIRTWPTKDHLILILGPDAITSFNDDLNVLFTHEFLHLYSYSKLNKQNASTTMATPLWDEGFATWISLQLNPGRALVDALGDAFLAHACADRAVVAKYARDYLAVLDKIASGWRDLAEMAGWPESRYSQLERDALVEIASP